MPPAVIRDVLVVGFDVVGWDAVEVVGVVAGGRVVEGVVLGAVGDGFVVGVVGTESVVDLLVGTDGWELLDVEAFVDEPDPDVVTTDGLAVSGTRPLLVGSAPGADEQLDTTSTAPSIAPTVRLLNCVMNLSNPPAEQPPGCSYLTPEITRRARNLPELSTRSTRRTRDEARSTPDRVTR